MAFTQRTVDEAIVRGSAAFDKWYKSFNERYQADAVKSGEMMMGRLLLDQLPPQVRDELAKRAPDAYAKVLNQEGKDYGSR